MFSGGGLSCSGLHPLLHTASNSGQRPAAIGSQSPLLSDISTAPVVVLVPLSLWAFYILEDWSFKSIVLNKTKTFLKITVLLCELLVYGVNM